MKSNKIKITLVSLGLLVVGLAIGLVAKAGVNTTDKESLMDKVQKQTLNYFIDGAEPISGMARERYHVDGVYPSNDKHIVTSGGSGFGIMAIIAGIDRGLISREKGIQQLTKIINFLEKADRFHGAFPHWWNGETGKVADFSEKDNGGDLVETSFLVQGLLCLNQYLINGTSVEKDLAQRADKLWQGVEWNWYTNNENALYWHWSPNHNFGMQLPISGYNECLITYVLAASSPNFSISEDVYHHGWAHDGDMKHDKIVEGYPLQFNKSPYGDPLFWAHYSYLGLDPNGLTDVYGDYFAEAKNQTLVNRAYCIRNPKAYEGYGENCWGLTASYTVNGYRAHAPHEDRDFGVITPTAALSSIVYTPEFSLQAMEYYHNTLGDKLWGEYGFYDAFSITENWFPEQYLAIDQGPIVVMIENHRSGLLWKLFMSHPDVQNGLRKLKFESPHLKNQSDISETQITEQLQVKIAGNQATIIFTLNKPSLSLIDVLTSSGKPVHSQKVAGVTGQNEITITLSNKGTYVVRIQSDEETKTTKFIF